MGVSIWQQSLSAIGIFFLSARLLGVRANDLQTASVYVHAGRFSEAVGILKNYAARDEDESKINLLTRKIYLAIDKPAKALVFFELADSLSLDNIDAQLGIALCELQLGKFAAAKRVADSISHIDKQTGEPLYIRALIMARTGRMEDAISSIEQASNKQADSEIIALASARFYVLTGDVEKAKQRISSFITLKPEAASTLDLLDELHQKIGDLVAARAARNKALNLYNDQGDSYRAAVMRSWLEANPVAPQPEKPSVEAKPAPDKKSPEPIAQKRPETGEARSAFPVVKLVMPDVESNIAVQRFPFPSGVTIIGGSGFIVDAGRKVVTNRHVVEGGKEFAIRTGLG